MISEPHWLSAEKIFEELVNNVACAKSNTARVHFGRYVPFHANHFSESFMKLFVSLFAFASVCLVAIACSNTADDAAAACKKLDSLCSSTSDTTKDGGASVTVTTKCDSKELESLSNASEVIDCINGASMCQDAVGCSLKAKK